MSEVKSQLWKHPVSVEELNTMNLKTIHAALGIVFTEVGDHYLEALMPVHDATRNPKGILHGGASVVLAESLGSVASVLVAGPEDHYCMGIEINASHLNAMRSGTVIGRATPIRLGRSLHVWDIQIRDGSDPTKRVCSSRITVVVKNKSAR
jgi:uncharacterized protein (TIGR00369 family)